MPSFDDFLNDLMQQLSDQLPDAPEAEAEAEAKGGEPDDPHAYMEHWGIFMFVGEKIEGGMFTHEKPAEYEPLRMHEPVRVLVSEAKRARVSRDLTALVLHDGEEVRIPTRTYVPQSHVELNHPKVHILVVDGYVEEGEILLVRADG